jgi:molecular chaperone HtpG
MLENSPYLESCKAAGQEVLLLTDNIDEFVMHHLGSYKDKKLKAVDRATADDRKEDEQAAMQFRPLLEALKRRLAEVKDVRLSSRLKESAAVLVADEHGPSAHFERLMERVGRKDEVGATKRILELNPQHPAVQSLKKLHETRPDDPKVETFARLLHDQAVIAEGSKIKDPASFARRINELMTAVTH